MLLLIVKCVMILVILAKTFSYTSRYLYILMLISSSQIYLDDYKMNGKFIYN
jgi:hypothetical protein